MEPYNIWFLCLGSFTKHGFEADLLCSMYQDFISFTDKQYFEIDIPYFFNPFMSVWKFGLLFPVWGYIVNNTMGYCEYSINILYV